jgi:hypothetical protein
MSALDPKDATDHAADQDAIVRLRIGARVARK